MDTSLTTTSLATTSLATAFDATSQVPTPQVLLEHYLKLLRLPTFGREYDKVAQQCAQEDVDHPRYLLRLCELEILEIVGDIGSGSPRHRKTHTSGSLFGLQESR